MLDVIFSTVTSWIDDQRKKREFSFKIAAKHFGLDILDVLGDPEIEERLLARYEEAGLEWPPLEDLEV